MQKSSVILAERSECAVFAKSKDPVAFTADDQRPTKPPRQGCFAALHGRERDIDAGRPENATEVLRLGSVYRDWKSVSSARLAQDDGMGKQYFA